MKNFSIVMFLAGICVTTFGYANWGYQRDYQNTYDMDDSIDQSQPYDSYQSGGYDQRGQPTYPGYGRGFRRNDTRSSDQRNNSSQNVNDQRSKNWFGSDDNKVTIPDDRISAHIMRNLRSIPYFSNGAKNIQVMTKDGKVTLTGKVVNKNEKNQIEYMVKNVVGVKSVSNDLETEK